MYSFFVSSEDKAKAAVATIKNKAGDANYTPSYGAPHNEPMQVMGYYVTACNHTASEVVDEAANGARVSRS